MSCCKLCACDFLQVQTLLLFCFLFVRVFVLVVVPSLRRHLVLVLFCACASAMDEWSLPRLTQTYCQTYYWSNVCVRLFAFAAPPHKDIGCRVLVSHTFHFLMERRVETAVPS